MTREDLQGALTHDNVQAFLRVLRAGESSQTEDAYNVMFGGDHFTSFADHPRQKHTRGQWTSTAAGAYQFLQRTWDGLVKQYAFPDFSPRSQDEAAVALIAGRGALKDVIAGRLDAAILKCAKEWASLPGSPYGQPTRTKAQARETYLAYGGRISDTPQEQPMPPIVLTLLQIASQLIPQLGQLFGSGSEVANRNVAAGKVVADKLVEVTQSINLQEAVEKIQNDPAALRDAKSAVAELWPSITESGSGGIGQARKDAGNPDQLPFWKNGAFVIAMFLAPLIYMVAIEILFNPSKQTWSDDIKMMFVTAIVSGLLGSITGFFLGSSLGSQRKTEKGVV